jgi:hypothetical protein
MTGADGGADPGGPAGRMTASRRHPRSYPALPSVRDQERRARVACRGGGVTDPVVARPARLQQQLRAGPALAGELQRDPRSSR